MGLMCTSITYGLPVTAGSGAGFLLPSVIASATSMPIVPPSSVARINACGVWSVLAKSP
jgi:hypothetical protein